MVKGKFGKRSKVSKYYENDCRRPQFDTCGWQIFIYCFTKSVFRSSGTFLLNFLERCVRNCDVKNHTSVIFLSPSFYPFLQKLIFLVFFLKHCFHISMVKNLHLSDVLMNCSDLVLN